MKKIIWVINKFDLKILYIFNGKLIKNYWIKKNKLTKYTTPKNQAEKKICDSNFYN